MVDDSDARATARKRAADEEDAAKSQENARKTQAIEEEAPQEEKQDDL